MKILDLNTNINNMPFDEFYNKDGTWSVATARFKDFDEVRKLVIEESKHTYFICQKKKFCWLYRVKK